MAIRNVLVGLLSLPFLFVVACATKDKPETGAAARAVDPVKRGEQLVTIGGCNDCHTPMKFDANVGMPVPDRSRLLSGHPEGAPDPTASPGQGDQAVIGPTFTSFRAPFGVVYAANLTPDTETGLGGWTADDFVRTVRTGKHHGVATGRPILPPMPWMNLAAQSDEDLRAIFSYLRTVPAVKNEVPAPKVPPQAISAIDQGFQKLRTN